jgi:UDP-N-acetylmuramoyl-L-alanyl-D-glutamate--2,6-diaminopimelate ligase
MRLSELCRGIAVMEGPIPEIDITDVAFDSRKAGPGCLFVAISGFKADGRRFVEDAVKRGAAAVAAETDCPGLTVPVLRVGDSRHGLAMLARRFFGDPSARMLTVGITGTNGKTTVSYLVESVLKTAGFETGLLGTIAYRWKGHAEQAGRTTPESLDLQRLLAAMAEDGVCALVMEVSSHSLALDRVAGMTFQAAVFTNLTRDHLDFHGDFEHYAEAKAGLFRRVRPGGAAVANADDPAAGRMLSGTTGRPVFFGLESPAADYRIEALAMQDGFTRFDLVHAGRRHPVKTPLWGRYNAFNAAAAAVCGLELGIDAGDVLRGIETADRVPGRMEGLASRSGIRIVVDYAHTPDALENVLVAVRGFTAGRVVTVFGCGGDRDRGKRPQMGRIAAALSDRVIVTSDNPRTEDPDAILTDVLAGAPDDGKTAAIPDREEAIRAAIDEAVPGDTVLIAGKGHEEYQEILGVRHPFNDRKAAEAALADRGDPAA